MAPARCSDPLPRGALLPLPSPPPPRAPRCSPPPSLLSHLPVLAPCRGLLHQSPQSKIDEGKPKSRVHGLVKEKSNKKGERIKKSPAHQLLCSSASLPHPLPISVGGPAIPPGGSSVIFGAHIPRLCEVLLRHFWGSFCIFPCLVSCLSPTSGLPHPFSPFPWEAANTVNRACCSQREPSEAKWDPITLY